LLNPWLFIDGALFYIIIPVLLIYSFILIRTHWRLALSIFFLNAGFLVFTFNSHPGKWGYLLQKPWYEETTRLIETGKINSNRLPFPNSLLAACNQVTHQNKYTFYFTEIDYLDFSGYLHSTDGSLPNDEFFSDPYPIDSKEICEPIDDMWFYCSHSD
jgi:hypothetical protein